MSNAKAAVLLLLYHPIAHSGIHGAGMVLVVQMSGSVCSKWLARLIIAEVRGRTMFARGRVLPIACKALRLVCLALFAAPSAGWCISRSWR